MNKLIKIKYKGRNNTITIIKKSNYYLLRLQNKHGFKWFFVESNIFLTKKQIYKMILKISDIIVNRLDNITKYDYMCPVLLSLNEYKTLFN